MPVICLNFRILIYSMKLPTCAGFVPRDVYTRGTHYIGRARYEVCSIYSLQRCEVYKAEMLLHPELDQ